MSNKCGRTCQYYRTGSTVKGKRNTARAKRAHAKKLKYQKAHNAKPEERKKRSELVKLNRKMGKKGDGKDVSHQSNGTVKLESASKNRGNTSRTPGDRKARGGKRKMQSGGTVGNGDVSTHLMTKEYIPGKGWVAFPTLFQNEDGTWLNMGTKDIPWEEAYEEAQRRGEVYEFGEDLEQVQEFVGEGSLKDNSYAFGGGIGQPKQGFSFLNMFKP